MKASQNQYLLELLRAGVFCQPPRDISYDDVDWDGLLDIASKHGLIAWVWRGISMLPKEKRPSRIQMISWELSAEHVWAEYNRQKTALNELLLAFGQMNVKVLLLKGIGLSTIYKEPESRPTGDLDIYLFENYKLGNDLLADYLTQKNVKHSEFDYKGVHVENHQTFLDDDTSLRRTINNYLEQSLSEAICTSEGYYVLEHKANLVFLAMHTMIHLVNESDISMRRLLDVPMFLLANKEDLPPETVYHEMSRLGIGHYFELLVYLGEWILNIDLSLYHRNLLSKSDLESAKKMLVFHEYVEEIPSDSTFVEQLRLRILQQKQQKWKYHFENVSRIKRLRLFLWTQLNVMLKHIIGVPEDVLIKNALEVKFRRNR